MKRVARIVAPLVLAAGTVVYVTTHAQQLPPTAATSSASIVALTPPQPDHQKAIAIVQKMHDELNRLEVGANLEGQTKYFADDVIRMDPFRPMLKGKQQAMTLAKKLRTSGFKVTSATTKVIDAWQEGSHIYEYGTTELVGRYTAGGGAARDPVDYFAMVSNPDPNSTPQVQLIIWNTTKPMATALNSLSKAAVR